MPSRLQQFCAGTDFPIHNTAVVPAPATSASKGKTTWPRPTIRVTFNGKVVDIRKRDRIYNRTGQRLDLLGGQCPRWVKSGLRDGTTRCPLCGA